jgi:hypothetical protein
LKQFGIKIEENKFNLKVKLNRNNEMLVILRKNKIYSILVIFIVLTCLQRASGQDEEEVEETSEEGISDFLSS